MAFNPYQQPTQPMNGLPQFSPFFANNNNNPNPSNPMMMAGQQQQQYAQGQQQMDFGNGNQLFSTMMSQGQAFMANPATNLALQHGFSVAENYVGKNLSRFVTINKLKYYFAVNTSYVARKLRLVLFPFLNRDWSRKHGTDPSTNSISFLPPRDDVNAPDLYIPVMAFVTYVLLVGFWLGVQNKFTIELLGMTASSALVWYIFEVAAMSLSMYIMNINCPIQTMDLMAYCGYKYVGMIVTIISMFVLNSLGSSAVLLFCCLSLSFYLVKTLRLAMVDEGGAQDHGYKRRTYFILSIVAAQVLLSFYLTIY
ncbi:hypothetical protein CAOG_02588 [Capsaspora owczarzaki ATCC 30864]|uniref:Protein YIF1 n=1 Tax=Capsaspora owczarzaki (strain ATCC 30864) TaxID=595528 RepID=A0A0D2U8Q6_CAPO3|nr:hypothetical protein CAOG_02588 [Capsaspora owczarzaki ATCC 30864]KJE91456.1 hypothetical protein CAOG_002588 [Capsaspora owczarzaki ATCC 30864]|eukprot:XP_004349338.1 hypothetical protein CAOG_02588 [Capsaspora owczarzaki ATCC 30864]